MRRLYAVLPIGLTVLLAACGSSNSKTTAPPTTIAGKPAITTVVLLTHSSFAASKSVLAEFTKETGYKVKLVQPGDAGVMVNEAILRKDHPVADALYGVDNTFLSRALDADIFEPYSPPALGTITVAAPDTQHRVTPIDTANVCVVYDKAWFGHSGRPAPPASLDDLADPRYKNLTVTENAATSSPGLSFLLATIAEKGNDGWQPYWKALKDNGLRVVDDWTEAYQTDFTAGGGSGDRPIVVSYGSDPAADVVFSDPHRATPNVGVIASTCFQQTEYAGVLHNAHNSTGGQALVNFLLSKAFQQDMPLQMYVNPVVKGAQLPAVYQQWAVVPAEPLTMDAATIGAHRDTWIKEWTDLVVQ